jgi:hypothetical protein
MPTALLSILRQEALLRITDRVMRPVYGKFFFPILKYHLNRFSLLRLRGRIYLYEKTQFHKDYYTQPNISVRNDVWFPLTKFSHLLKTNYRNSTLVGWNWDKNCYKHLVLDLPLLISVDTKILPKRRKLSCQMCGHNRHKEPGAFCFVPWTVNSLIMRKITNKMHWLFLW